ncbi:hypothetical protein P692DRAFT_20827396 [Suillus brevipes Sb2]|nr:hypothetical protein P692DRAFT_20827396 [Suillus brevipes Sb2]
MAIYVVICDIAAGIAIEVSQAALRMQFLSCQDRPRSLLQSNQCFVVFWNQISGHLGWNTVQVTR